MGLSAFLSKPVLGSVSLPLLEVSGVLAHLAASCWVWRRMKRMGEDGGDVGRMIG